MTEDHEHTENEILGVVAAYGTAKLVQSVFVKAGELQRVSRKIERLTGTVYQEGCGKPIKVWPNLPTNAIGKVFVTSSG